MEQMSQTAFHFYREKIVENPELLEYFEQATPVNELQYARMGSRPARRQATHKIEDLRAIPWVFGWIQSRHGLPAWFGVGHALETFASADPSRAATLKSMMAGLPVFAGMIRSVSLGMAKADFSIARMYAGLVQDSGLRERVFGMLLEEFNRTRSQILSITSQSELLEGNPVLAQSIRLRNPYVDPMSLIQVELLRRKREAPVDAEADAETNNAIAATINGIAAGLHNVG
jgi:phosphoenolpyruvate carboxylase